jgi:hypothetical protein
VDKESSFLHDLLKQEDPFSEKNPMPNLAETKALDAHLKEVDSKLKQVKETFNE